jgi:SAM-dependent methyltransferase
VSLFGYGSLLAMGEPSFDADLYRGSGSWYDRYRLPYPPSMLSSLLERVSGRSRLMDLACGTGQLAFALRSSFSSTWAVDQEPSMIGVVSSRGLSDVRAIVSSAEELDAPASAFDLVVIGNAFHRLDRDRVAARIFSWLRPGGSLALCWSDSPWVGEAAWQEEFRAVIDSWRDRLGDRLPAGWGSARAARPDGALLEAAGFSLQGRSSFAVSHQWTVPELAGFVYSTSFLPRSSFGDSAGAFEQELNSRLPGALVSRVSYAFDLALKSTGMRGG